MNNQESTAPFERIIKKITIPERQEQNEPTERAEQSEISSFLYECCTTNKYFCNNLRKHRWIAFSVDLMGLFLQNIYFLTVSKKTLALLSLATHL